MKTKTTLIALSGAAALMVATLAAAGPGERGHGNLFKKLDADGSGSISQSEINTAGSKHFDKLDTNGDGTLSKAEFSAPKVKMLNRADADENGEISKSEWEAAKQLMREHHRK